MREEYEGKESSYFAFDRQDIVAYLPRSANRICEIGCGAAATLINLKKRYKASFVAGFDIHAPSIAAAKSNLDHAEVINIEETRLPDYVSDIDLFLCLDILEHLRDPWALVADLHSRLRHGGSIVASIPNIRHHSVSVGLLFRGKWQLQNHGLLDRTHLRFFVRDTARELMESSGLRVDVVAAKIGRRLDRAAIKLSLGLLEDVCALQYIIRATKVN